MKDQKQVQEDISRMSSKAISKVQDDIKSLRQLLSVSASGLQRQALAIDKLKLETAQVKTISPHTGLSVRGYTLSLLSPSVQILCIHRSIVNMSIHHNEHLNFSNPVKKYT